MFRDIIFDFQEIDLPIALTKRVIIQKPKDSSESGGMKFRLVHIVQGGEVKRRKTMGTVLL